MILQDVTALPGNASAGSVLNDIFAHEDMLPTKIFNLRSDPFELADHIGIGYAKWRLDRPLDRARPEPGEARCVW